MYSKSCILLTISIILLVIISNTACTKKKSNFFKVETKNILTDESIQATNSNSLDEEKPIQLDVKTKQKIESIIQQPITDKLSCPDEMINFILPNSQEDNWFIEKKFVNSDAITIINELIKIPEGYFPEDIKILGVVIQNNIAYVNLSKEIECSSNGIYRSDHYLEINLKSIVNTLCLNQSLNITSVQFLVEGKADNLLGSMMIYPPLTPDIELTDIN